MRKLFWALGLMLAAAPSANAQTIHRFEGDGMDGSGTLTATGRRDGLRRLYLKLEPGGRALLRAYSDPNLTLDATWRADGDGRARFDIQEANNRRADGQGTVQFESRNGRYFLQSVKWSGRILESDRDSPNRDNDHRDNNRDNRAQKNRDRDNGDRDNRAFAGEFAPEGRSAPAAQIEEESRRDRENHDRDDDHHGGSQNGGSQNGGPQNGGSQNGGSQNGGSQNGDLRDLQDTRSGTGRVERKGHRDDELRSASVELTRGGEVVITLAGSESHQLFGTWRSRDRDTIAFDFNGGSTRDTPRTRSQSNTRGSGSIELRDGRLNRVTARGQFQGDDFSVEFRAR